MSDRMALHSVLNRPVRMPAALRIGLALVIVLGGLLFLLFPVMLAVMPRPRPMPHPLGAAVLMVAMFAMGCGFLYVASRLIRSAAHNVDLLGPRARKVCSFVVGGSAVAMLAFAWHEASVLMALNAVTATVMAYALSRPTGLSPVPDR